MMEVVLALPFFLIIFLGVMRFGTVFSQKIGNRIAARHVGEGRVYLMGEQSFSDHFTPARVSSDHLFGREATLTSEPGSLSDKAADEGLLAAAVTKAAIETGSVAIYAIFVSFGFTKDGVGSGVYTTTVNSSIPDSRIWKLKPQLTSTFYIERGMWNYDDLGYPGVWGVRAALLGGIIESLTDPWALAEHLIEGQLDKKLGGVPATGASQQSRYGSRVSMSDPLRNLWIKEKKLLSSPCSQCLRGE